MKQNKQWTKPQIVMCIKIWLLALLICFMTTGFYSMAVKFSDYLSLLILPYGGSVICGITMGMQLFKTKKIICWWGLYEFLTLYVLCNLMFIFLFPLMNEFVQDVINLNELVHQLWEYSMLADQRLRLPILLVNLSFGVGIGLALLHRQIEQILIWVLTPIVKRLPRRG